MTDDIIWINGVAWQRVASFTGPGVENVPEARIIPCRYERTETGFRLVPDEEVSVKAGETFTLEATIPKEPEP